MRSEGGGGGWLETWQIRVEILKAVPRNQLRMARQPGQPYLLLRERAESDASVGCRITTGNRWPGILALRDREGERNKSSKQLPFLVDISKRMEAGAKEGQRMKPVEIDIEIVPQDPIPFILYHTTISCL